MSDAVLHTERRVDPRVTIGLHVVEVDEGTTYFQYATDLSTGGMFLYGTAPREIGRRIMLLFKLPGEEQINRIPAEVVGNDQGGRRGTHLKFVAPVRTNTTDNTDDTHGASIEAASHVTSMDRLRAYVADTIAA